MGSFPSKSCSIYLHTPTNVYITCICTCGFYINELLQYALFRHLLSKTALLRCNSHITIHTFKGYSWIVLTYSWICANIAMAQTLSSAKKETCTHYLVPPKTSSQPNTKQLLIYFLSLLMLFFWIFAVCFFKNTGVAIQFRMVQN